MLLKLGAAMILGGAAEMDRTSVFHGLLFEPIVLCPIMGLVLGFPAMGLKVGAIMQMFFMGSVSMGGSSPPDSAMSATATMMAGAMVTHYLSVIPEVAFPTAILVCMAPAGHAGSFVDLRIKELNVRFLHTTEEAIETEGEAAIERNLRKSLAVSFVVFTGAAAFLATAGGIATGVALHVAPPEWYKSIESLTGLMLIASAGVALASLREHRAVTSFSIICAALTAVMVGLSWLS